MASHLRWMATLPSGSLAMTDISSHATTPSSTLHDDI